MAAIQFKPRSWPLEPITLREGRSSLLATFLKDSLMLSLPLLFMVLGILAQRLDGQPVSEYGSRIQFAMSLGPTVFPVAFAAIAGTALRSLARARLEKGEKLGILEQLIGSQSLASTLAWLVELRRIHVTGVAIVFMWFLSPLGGQSALRLMSVELTPVQTTLNVSYAMFDNRTESILTSSDAREAEPAMTAYYAAALIGAHQNKHKPADIWGNPKIPLIDSIPEHSGDWRSITDRDSVDYASLIGVRLQGFCEDCNATISMETSHTVLTCQNTAHFVPDTQVMDLLGPHFSGWFPSNESIPFIGLFTFFPFASGYGYWGQASPTDNFVGGYVAPYNFSTPRDWRDVSDFDISRRLTQVFNSIRHTTVSPWSITNAEVFEPLVCDEGIIGNITSVSTKNTAVNDCTHMVLTPASISRLIRTYKSSPVWIALLLISSLVLFLLGLLSMFLQLHVSVPDVLGYVSTVTRNNPYTNLPSAATALEGTKRTHALQDMKIQLTDVRPYDEIGYLAIRTIADGDMGPVIGKIDKNRHYE
ncbi:hypothetical protein yc1106_06521 [Curvularia clavata]|uniref:Uncharacterized protein n=1 Tax=Curvularia clavata TaxID=95742 RepID=A0A9Q8ZBV8_CURCL|nr:hypothetical protein yc1106_06521 [Curvularia clavata]